ncbi:alpha/beta hydrolase [Halioglobus maricola]|uniref:Monoacylglycerol lipase n=1 Tax=Halioglobus maricola TaxID=2601894 RepID=A0A5P9NPE1_9GAMM|nr:alpha/beta hydrolase [Halioglobus maricola]QFU77681.1 alpha/beta hydrolase [Halioglobus maricola]
MQHRDGRFQGAAGHSIYYQYWTPEDPPKAVVLLVHGAGEHSNRYRHVAELLTGKGFAVAALDHIGHGQSDGEYGHMEKFQHYLDTLEIFRRQVSWDFDKVPMFLLGHSMGGLISALYLLEYQDEFLGAALSGPAIKTDIEPGKGQLLSIKLLSKTTPSLGVLQLDSEGVSRDPAVVAAYNDDPLVHHGKMSARFVSELFNGMNTIQAEAHKITLPLLLMHGEADSMTSAEGSKHLNGKVRSEDKTLKLYPKLYHEIFNEPEQDEVLGDLLAWLEQRLPS